MNLVIINRNKYSSIIFIKSLANDNLSFIIDSHVECIYLSLYKNPSKELLSILIGGTIIFFVGVIDDKYNLNAWVKLFFEIVASLIPIYYGVKVNFITNPKGGYLYLKELSIPFTILWITGITNAIKYN